MSKQKVTLRIEEGEVELLKEKYSTDNQSEAIRLAIMGSLATEDSKKVKTLFPYIGKKPPRIGREVVNAFEQSECKIFVDLFLNNPGRNPSPVRRMEITNPFCWKSRFR